MSWHAIEIPQYGTCEVISVIGPNCSQKTTEIMKIVYFFTMPTLTKSLKNSKHVRKLPFFWVTIKQRFTFYTTFSSMVYQQLTDRVITKYQTNEKKTNFSLKNTFFLFQKLYSYDILNNKAEKNSKNYLKSIIAILPAKQRFKSTP